MESVCYTRHRDSYMCKIPSESCHICQVLRISIANTMYEDSPSFKIRIILYQAKTFYKYIF